MKVRIKFAKYGAMKYVGHLDLMRYFQKAIRRSDLPIRYSEGFNPHQIMSFAAPLGVGMTSGGEYMDIELTEDVPSADGLRRLQEQMVEGVEILQFRYLPDGAKNAMASVTAAKYEIRWNERDTLPTEQLRREKEAFYDNAAAIPAVKTTKKGERTIDLRPLIREFLIGQEGDGVVCRLTLSAGSADNIKPQFVLDAFFSHLGMDAPACGMKRVDLFTEKDARLLSLGEIGNDR